MSKVKCKGCKQYVERDSALRIGLSSYCDRDCLYSAQTKKPKQQSKKISTVNREPLSEELRNYVLTKDCNRCRLCGKTNNLAVHHVIYKSDKKNKRWQDQASNLITLCNQPCHLDIVHKNKKKFQKLCLGIIWLREVEGDRYTTIYKLEERLK